MFRRIVLLGLLGSFVTTASFAALKPGDPAPDFSAQASIGGSVFTFSLYFEIMGEAKTLVPVGESSNPLRRDRQN